jgi:alkylated DNA repair dioxygenase AlkB
VTIAERPEGLVYEPDVLTEDEERALLDEIERLAFDEIRMHGVVARRTAKHFGLGYDYERRTPVEDAEPIPDWLLPVRAKAAALAGVAPDELVEVLVQRYPEGAQNGWHRDAPNFGTVVGVSLLGPSRLRFRRGTGDARRTFEVQLAPRSGYVLAGPARTAWQHHIPPTKSLRYSITFRDRRWASQSRRRADPPRDDRLQAGDPTPAHRPRLLSRACAPLLSSLSSRRSQPPAQAPRVASCSAVPSPGVRSSRSSSETREAA